MAGSAPGRLRYWRVGDCMYQHGRKDGYLVCLPLHERRTARLVGVLAMCDGSMRRAGVDVVMLDLWQAVGG